MDKKAPKQLTVDQLAKVSGGYSYWWHPNTMWEHHKPYISAESFVKRF